MLYQQDRHELAEAEIRQALGESPSDATAHSWLALCLLEMERFQDATVEARDGIALAPDDGFSHYAHGRVLLARDSYAEARAALLEAIRLDPGKEQYWGTLAAIHMLEEKPALALEAADHGLSIDPTDSQCANMRAMALVRLGRRAEAATTMQGALERDPEDAVTHANQGWAHLHAGKAKEAMESFRESLRLNPTSDWARAGIVEAMKARWWPYRILLRYFLWAGRLDSRWRIGLFLGLWLAVQFVSKVKDASPAVQAAADAFVTAYIVFALTTWFASPLFNLLLRLNRFGRHALSASQTIEANWVGILTAASLTFLVARYATGRPVLLIISLVFAGLLFPLVALFMSSGGWPRVALALYLGGMAFAGLIICAGVAVSISGNSSYRIFDVLAALLFQPYLWAAVLSSWVGPVLAAIRPRRE